MTQGYRKLGTTTEQMLAWRHEDGLDNKAIAERAKCSVAAVYARIGGQKKYRPREPKVTQVQ
jgi:hypothetical protein